MLKYNLITIIAFILIGCGSRKVEVSSSMLNQSTITKTTDTLAVKTTMSATSIDTTKCEEYTISAIDSTKEIELNINGKLIKGKNIRFKQKKTTKGISSSIKKDSVANELKISQIEHTQECLAKSKKIERKSTNWWIVITIAVAAVLFFLTKPKSTK